MVERAFLFQLEYLSQIVLIEILRIMIDKGLSSETLRPAISGMGLLGRKT